MGLPVPQTWYSTSYCTSCCTSYCTSHLATDWYCLPAMTGDPSLVQYSTYSVLASGAPEHTAAAALQVRCMQTDAGRCRRRRNQRTTPSAASETPTDSTTQTSASAARGVRSAARRRQPLVPSPNAIGPVSGCTELTMTDHAHGPFADVQRATTDPSITGQPLGNPGMIFFPGSAWP